MQILGRTNRKLILKSLKLKRKLFREIDKIILIEKGTGKVLKYLLSKERERVGVRVRKTQREEQRQTYG